MSAPSAQMADLSTRIMSDSAVHGVRSPPMPTKRQLEGLVEALVPGGVVSSVRRLAGGISCAMDVLAVTAPGGVTHRFILRRHPMPVSGGTSTVRREAHALDLARAAGVPAPVVVSIDDHGVLDQPTLVLSFIEGRPPAGSINTHGRAEQMAEELARVHSARLDARYHELLEHYLPGEGDDGVTVPDALAAHRLGPPLLDRIRLLRKKLVDVHACFVHGDYHPGNTLWSDSDLVGIVDWEIAGIADPAFDVAYCATDIRYLGLGMYADWFIDSYRRLSGRTLPNLAYWTGVALARAMPDVASWLPGFTSLDGKVTAAMLRRRHSALVEEFLAA